jgi:signal transduction histidine kinase
MPEALQRPLLQSVIRQLPTAVIVAEAPSGKIVAANEAVARIWRHPAIFSEDVDGYREYRGFHHDGTPYRQDEWPLARSLNGDTVEHEEIRIQRGDGTWGYIRVDSSPIVDDDGSVSAAVATLFDITDERREQEALALLAEISATASESLVQDETLRDVTRLTVPRFADLTILHLLSGGRALRAAVAAIDRAAEERVRDLWIELPTPPPPIASVAESGISSFEPRVDDQFWDDIADERHRQSAKAMQIRAWMTVPIRASGKTYGTISFAMTTSGRAFDSFDFLVAEELGRRAGTAVERSQLFEAERAQRINRERTARRISHLQQLTAALQPAITVEAVCDAAVREASQVVSSRATVIGLVRDGELAVLRTVGIAKPILEQFSHLPLDSPWPIVVAARTGAAVWLHDRDEAIAFAPIIRDVSQGRAWACLPLMIEGRPIGAIGFVFDEPQEFGEEERSYLENLAGQCAIALERALLFDRERTARETAEAASRAKDEFLAILSHELRTPMTTVIGWADYLKMMHASDASIIGPVDALRASAKTQAKLVDDLLDVSRIIARKLSIRMGDADLAAVVRAAVDSVRFPAQTKELTLDVQLPAAELPVNGDPDRLQQIFTNLLVNAIKFTPAGGRVTVRAERRDAEIDIVVEDSGEGISPEFLPHVFDRFRQASSGDSRRHTGLGIGLSIVQHLAELHGGRVRAESGGIGKGARFTVTLPARRE